MPAADPGSRSFTAVIRIDSSAEDGAGDPTAALLPGLFVRAELTLRQVDGQPVTVAGVRNTFRYRLSQ